MNKLDMPDEHQVTKTMSREERREYRERLRKWRERGETEGNAK